MTFPIWKSIIVNWVNCYGHKVKDFSELADFQILSSIVSKFGGGENQSSVQSSQAVEHFIGLHYPKLTLENSLEESPSDKDLYLVSSVLLYHVCVSVKNVKLKKKMCNKLSADDQQMIMKFTTILMGKDKEPIESVDITNAISEICGLESPAPTPERSTSQTSVSTPPVMKMLHERNRDIKQLTAELEAEKFDRTYLQDELARTQAKLERVSIDNEKYQKELKALKSQVEGRLADSCDLDETDHTKSTERKQVNHEVEQLEVKLAGIIAELEEAYYNNKLLNAKMDETRLQRDTYAEQLRETTNQFIWMSSDLETQKRMVAQLQEVNNELTNHLHRQHNKSLECDDSDAAQLNRSCFQDQSSVCEEPCLGVIEIQLNEERARSSELSQTNQELLSQIKSMQHLQEDLMRRLVEQRNFLRGQIKENKELAENFNVRLESIVNELEVSEKQASTSFEQNVDFTKKLNDIIAEVVREMNHEIDNKKTDIKRQETSMKEMEYVMHQMMHDIRELNTAVKTQMHNYSTSLDNFEHTYERKISTVSAHIDHLKHLIQVVSHHIAVTVQEKATKIANLSENLERTSQEKIELENYYAVNKTQLECTVAHCQHTIEQLNCLLQREINLKLNIQNDLNAEINDLKKLRAEAENDIKMYEDKCAKLLDYMKEKDVKIDDLTDKVTHLKGYLETVEVDLKNKDLYIDEVAEKQKNLILTTEKEIAELKYDYELKLTDMSLSLLAAQTLQKNTESELKAKENALRKVTDKYDQTQQNVESLKNDYDTLFEQNTKLHTEINKNNTTINSLKEEIKENCKEINKLVVDNNTRLLEIEKLEETAKQIANEHECIIYALNSQLAEHIEEEKKAKINIVNLETLINQKTLELDEQCKEFDTFKTKYHEMVLEKDNLMGEIMSINDDNTKMNMEIEIFKKHAEEELAKHSETIDAINNEKAELLAQMDKKIQLLEAEKEHQSRNIFVLESELSENKSNLESLTSKLDNLTAEKNNLLFLVETNTEEISVLRKKISDKQAICNELEQNLKELKHQYEVSLQENKNLQNNINDLEKNLNLFENKIKQLLEEIKILQDELKDEACKHKLQTSEIKKVIDTKHFEIKSLEEKLVEKDQSITEIQSNLKAKSLDVFSLNNQVSKLNVEKSKLMKTISDYDADIVVKGNEVAELNIKVNTLKTEFDSITDENEKMREENKKLNENICSSIDRIKQLDLEVVQHKTTAELECVKNAEIISAIEALNENLAENIQKFDRKRPLVLEQLREKILSIMTDYECLSESRESLLRENQNLKENINKLEAQISQFHICGEEIKAIAEKYEKIHAKAIEDIKIEKESLLAEKNNEIKDLENEIIERKQTIAELSASLAAKKNETTILADHLSNLTDKNNKLDEQISVNNKQVSELRDCINELRIVCKQLNEANILNESLKNEIEAVKSQQIQEKQGYEATINDLNNNLEILNREQTKLNMLVSTCDNSDVPTLPEKLENILKYKSFAEQTNFEQHEVIVKLKEKVTELSNQIQESNFAMENVNEEKSKVIMNIQEMKQEIAALNAIIKEKDEEIAVISGERSKLVEENALRLNQIVTKLKEKEDNILRLEYNLNETDDFVNRLKSEKETAEQTILDINQAHKEAIDALEIKFKKALKDKEKKINDCKNEIFSLQETVQAKEYCMDKMIDHLKIEKESKIEYQERFEAEQNYRETQAKRYESEIKSLSEIVLKLKESFDGELNHKTAELENQIQSCEKLNSEYKEVIKHTEAEHTRLSGQLEKLTERTNEWQKIANLKVVELNNNLQKSASNISCLANFEMPPIQNEEITFFEQIGKSLERNINVMAVTLNNTELLKNAVETLSSELNADETGDKTVKKPLDKSLKSILHDLKSVREDKATLERKLGEAEYGCKVLEELVKVTNESISKIKSGHDEDVQEILKVVHSNPIRMMFLSNQSKVNIDENKNNLIAIERGLASHKNVIFELHSENEKISNEVKILKDSCVKHEEELLKLKNEQIEKNTQVTILQEEVAKLKSDKSESFVHMSEQLNHLKIEKAIMDQTINDKGLMIKKIQEKKDTMAVELEKLNEKYFALAASEKVLQDDLERLRKELYNKEINLNDMIKSTQELKTVLDAKESQIDSVSECFNLKLLRSEQEIDQLKEVLIFKEAAIKIINADISENLNKLIEIMSKSSLVELDALSITSISDEQKILEKESDKQYLKTFASVENCLNNLIFKTNALYGESNNQKKTLENVVSEMETKELLIQALEQDIAAVELKMEELCVENKQSFEKIVEKDAEINSLKDEVAYANEKLKINENDMQLCATKYEKMHQEYEAVKITLNDLANHNEELETSLNKTNKSLKAFVNSIDITFEAISKGIDDDSELNKVLNSLEEAENDLAIFVTIKTDMKSRFMKINQLILNLKHDNEELMNVCQLLKVEKEAKIKTLAGEVEALSISVANREELVKNIKSGQDERIANLQMKVETLSTDSASKGNLEQMIIEKNNALATLQNEVVFLKNMLADSQNKLLDANKEVEASRENYEALSSQFKKTVQMKNENIDELEKRASNANQIVKLSARYETIIQKRIAELKSNNAFKDLTHLSNIASKWQDYDPRKSIAGVTVDDLERFLEYTEKHSKKLYEKYIGLQQEREKLNEMKNKYESEIETVKSFLNGLVEHFATMAQIKDTYNIKMTKIMSVQKSVRKEISNIEHALQDNVLLRLERRLGVTIEESSEIFVAMCKWMGTCIKRSISTEKVLQVMRNETPTLSSSDFQNTGLEVQIDELQNGLKKLLDELSQAKRCDFKGKSSNSGIMEVRAEYEEKLDRMKTRMKQLYQDQIISYKEKQQLEMKSLQSELHKTREQLAHRSKAYEDHISGLTRELWTYGEKLLMEKNEMEWLRRKHSTSLMSLQNLNSCGPPLPRRETLAVSQVKRADKNESRRGLQVEDEDGEVFDNRYLNELKSSPKRDQININDPRLSELQWRNSLCPPHLKSSYPAETQFRSGLKEDDIKSEAPLIQTQEKKHRKEVGITAYKKPGPPTPSKAAGRLSATDSELRDSIRMDPEAGASRKTSTPSRIRSLFWSRHDQENSLTPKSRRMSIFKRHK